MSKQQPTLTLTEGPRPVNGSPLVRGATLGRYVVLDLLGSGGMGVVYAAYDFGLDRRVCLKLVRDGGGERSAERQDRLLREARAAARISHPNVVTVHDVGTWEDHVFVAMELIEGLTLRKWLRAADRSPAEILEVFAQAGRGLAAAHAAALVHRDFKPDNVLVGNDGRVRVTDFGLARDLDALRGDGGHTSGTPAYMAPEQHRGEVASAATDQFSFALALYEALLGRSPYDATTGEELRAAKVLGRFAAAPGRSKVPSYLRPVLLKGLAPERSARHPSIEALLDALRPPRRSPARLAAGATATLFAATVAVAFLPADEAVSPATSASTLASMVAAHTQQENACVTPAPPPSLPAVAAPGASVTAGFLAASPSDARTAKRPFSSTRAAFDRTSPSTGTPAAISTSATRRPPPSFTVHVPSEPGEEEVDRSSLLDLVARLERALTELGILDEAPVEPSPQPLLAALGPGAAADQSRAAYLLGRYGDVLARAAPETTHHQLFFAPGPQSPDNAEVLRLEAELAAATDPIEAAKIQFSLARLLYGSDTTRALQLAREARETLRTQDVTRVGNLLLDVEDWLDDHGTRISRLPL